MLEGSVNILFVVCRSRSAISHAPVTNLARWKKIDG